MDILNRMKICRLAVVMFCAVFVCSCASGKNKANADESQAPGNVSGKSTQTVQNGFVSKREFCKARLIHVAAHVNFPEMPKGSCYVDETALPPGVAQVLRRTLKLYNLQIAKDQSSADYVLGCQFDNRYIARRTHTNIYVTFSKNDKAKTLNWSASAHVSGRGNFPVSTYAVSLAGAVMYKFRQSYTSGVGRIALQSFYKTLYALGE